MLDSDLLDEHERLTRELDELPEGRNSEALAEQIVQLEEQIAEAEVEFVFRGLGRGRWRKLIADHPPTEEDQADGAEFDTQEFPFVAMAACLESPALTVDDLKTLNDEALSEMTFNALWAACLTANLGGGVSRPESRAAHAIRANGRHSSEPQSDSAGPEAS